MTALVRRAAVSVIPPRPSSNVAALMTLVADDLLLPKGESPLRFGRSPYSIKDAALGEFCSLPWNSSSTGTSFFSREFFS